MLLHSFMQALLAGNNCVGSNVRIVVDNAAIVHQRPESPYRKTTYMATTSHKKFQLKGALPMNKQCQTQQVCRWDHHKRNIDSDLALGAPKRKGLAPQRFHSAPNLHSKSLSLPRMPTRTPPENSPHYARSQRKKPLTGSPPSIAVPIRVCSSSTAVVGLPPVRPAASFSAAPRKTMRDILGSLAPRSKSASERIRRVPTPAPDGRWKTTDGKDKDKDNASWGSKQPKAPRKIPIQTIQPTLYVVSPSA